MSLKPSDKDYQRIFSRLMGDVTYPKDGYISTTLDDRVTDLLKKENWLIQIKMFLKFIR